MASASSSGAGLIRKMGNAVDCCPSWWKEQEFLLLGCDTKFMWHLLPFIMKNFNRNTVL